MMLCRDSVVPVKFTAKHNSQEQNSGSGEQDCERCVQPHACNRVSPDLLGLNNLRDFPPLFTLRLAEWSMGWWDRMIMGPLGGGGRSCHPVPARRFLDIIVDSLDIALGRGSMPPAPPFRGLM